MLPANATKSILLSNKRPLVELPFYAKYKYSYLSVDPVLSVKVFGVCTNSFLPDFIVNAALI